MSNQRGVILTLEDAMNMMSSFAGGSVPASTDEEYPEWIRWIQLGQQDAANRGFWRRLLTKADLEIEADSETTDLPDDFYKVNGIHSLFVGETDWNQNNNVDGVRLFVETDPITGDWRIRWLPDAPTADETAELWYYRNPAIPTELDDTLTLDGEMIAYYALKEYFRKLKQLGSMDDARIEYENRFKELLALEMIPSPQELASFGSYNSHLNRSTLYNPYSTRSGRSRRG